MQKLEGWHTSPLHLMLHWPMAGISIDSMRGPMGRLKHPVSSVCNHRCQAISCRWVDAPRHVLPVVRLAKRWTRMADITHTFRLPRDQQVELTEAELIELRDALNRLYPPPSVLAPLVALLPHSPAPMWPPIWEIPAPGRSRATRCRASRPSHAGATVQPLPDPSLPWPIPMAAVALIAVWNGGLAVRHGRPGFAVSDSGNDSVAYPSNDSQRVRTDSLGTAGGECRRRAWWSTWRTGGSRPGGQPPDSHWCWVFLARLTHSRFEAALLSLFPSM